MKNDWGRHLLGLCMMLLGIVSLVWHRIPLDAAQRVVGTGFSYELVLYVTASVFIAGGVLIQIPRTSWFGAAAIAAVLGLFAVLGILESAATGAIATSWINLFETLGTFSGALIVMARSSDPPNTRLAGRVAMLFGVCAVTYALAQIVYFQYTASLVPEWIPPNQTFWTVFTTIAFALAAVAFLTGRCNLPAAQLLALMVAIFGVTIWVPAVIVHPAKLSNWTELTTNFGICSGAWILAEWLASTRRGLRCGRPAGADLHGS